MMKLLVLAVVLTTAWNLGAAKHVSESIYEELREVIEEAKKEIEEQQLEAEEKREEGKYVCNNIRARAPQLSFFFFINRVKREWRLCEKRYNGRGRLMSPSIRLSVHPRYIYSSSPAEK